MITQADILGHTNEHTSAIQLLRSVVLEGRMVTSDAVICQRDICRHITDSGGDYLVAVKDNQPELKETIESEFRSGRSPLQRTRSATAA
ncbi:transposase [Rosistilla ulvae]|uniref:transposase n=1 Tax=Rosistilla ulvae TaxID=1930277 RepID=UPI001C54D4D5